MAKKSSIEKNNRRRRMAKKFAGRRARLKAIVQGQEQAGGGAFRRDAQARRTAAQLVGHAHPQPLRSDRPAARLYRKHKLSRIALRELGSKGLIPGLVKSSW